MLTYDSVGVIGSTPQDTCVRHTATYKPEKGAASNVVVSVLDPL